MTVDVLTSRLEGVRKTGPDRGVARCAAHADRTASLSWRELSDGRILLHCFAGCSVHEVLSAVGLEMDALYPERPAAGMFNSLGRPERRPFPAADALLCLSFDVVFLAVVADDLAAGKPLCASDRKRLAETVGRIASAQEYCNAQ